jgi:hypothetical protein
MLQSDHELLARDARGPDDPGEESSAHDVTSNAKLVDDECRSRANRPRGERWTTAFGVRSP